MPFKITAAAAIVLLISFTLPAQAAGDIAAGKAKAATCIACHGESGQSTMPLVPGMIVPHIGGQYADYLVKALKDYRSGARQNPNMNSMVAGLSDEDIENLAAYYAAQSGLNVVEAR